MNRLHHISKLTLCVALLFALSLRANVTSAQLDEQLDKVSQQEIDANKKAMIIRVVKGLFATGVMLGLSQLCFIKGTGFEPGLIAGSLPAGIAAAVDDPSLKLAGYSAAVGATLIGGAGGLFVTEPMICEGGILDRLGNQTSQIAALLRDTEIPVPQSAAGAVAVFGAMSVYGGATVFNKVGRFAASKQILLEQYLKRQQNNK